MKMTKLLSSTLLLGALLFGASKASAQGGIAPSKQLGIGVFAGGESGASIQYAFSPAFQLGLGVGISGASRDGNSSTDYLTDLYGRFVFEGVVNPLIQVGFRRGSTDNTVGGVTTTTTSNSVYGGAGLEYFFNRNVGVFGVIDILAINFDPSVTTYGFNTGRLGLEWYFNP